MIRNSIAHDGGWVRSDTATDQRIELKEDYFFEVKELVARECLRTGKDACDSQGFSLAASHTLLVLGLDALMSSFLSGVVPFFPSVSAIPCVRDARH